MTATKGVSETCKLASRAQFQPSRSTKKTKLGTIRVLPSKSGRVINCTCKHLRERDDLMSRIIFRYLIGGLERNSAAADIEPRI